MAVSTITHRNLDRRHRVEEEDAFIFQQDDEDDEDWMPTTDEEWADEFWDEEQSLNDSDDGKDAWRGAKKGTGK